MVVTDITLNHWETGLETLKKSSLLGKDYAVIADPKFANKFKFAAQKILTDRVFSGVASATTKEWEKRKETIQDWKKEMEKHGYKNPVDWASQEGNLFLSRPVNTELRSYKVSHVKPEKNDRKKAENV